VQCSNCGFIYFNPRPTNKFMKKFYEKKYRYFYEGIKNVNEAYIQKRRWGEVAKYRYEKYNKYLSDGMRILDVGCGAGLFLKTIKEEISPSGIFGIEPNECLAKYSQEKLGPIIHNGFYEECNFETPFDLITVFHVLEHLHNLESFFLFLRKNLKENGFVFIETPNVAGSWEGIGMFHIAHLYAFTPRTISNLFRSNGFEIVEVQSIENEIDLSNLHLVAKKTSQPRPYIEPIDLEESKIIQEKCDRIKSTRATRGLRTIGKISCYKFLDLIGFLK